MKFLKCPCCGLDVVSPAIIDIYYALKRRFPDLILTRAASCYKHNKDVGGSSKSGHLPIWGPGKNECVAIDVALERWTEARGRQLFYEMIALGCRGVGWYPGDKHIHGDIKPRDQMWKKENGTLKYFF